MTPGKAIPICNYENAMTEWPRESRLRASNRVNAYQSIAGIPKELLRDVETSEAFSLLTRALAKALNNKAAPEETLAQLTTMITESSPLGDYDEFMQHVALAIAGIAVLRDAPTRDTWEYLWSLAWHSAPLETYLPQAVIVSASETGFRDQFFMIAKHVVEAAIRNPGRRAFPQERSAGASLRAHWEEQPQLSTLWLMHFDQSLHAVGRDDDHVLSIVAQIDLAYFVKLLALYDYPDPVENALTWCGAVWNFELWKELIAVAPPSFDTRAQWNGSLILPLLLKIGREQFAIDLRPDASVDEVSKATADIKNLASEVA